MAIEIIACPHCHVQMMPMPDGTCPSCRTNIGQVPVPSAIKESEQKPEEAWEKYQNSLRSASGRPAAIGSISEIDECFAELRTGAVGHFGADAAADGAAADRIQQEVLPRYAAAIEKLRQESAAGVDNHQDASGLIACAEMRMTSWQQLLEALRESDAQKLQRHITLWENAEWNLIGAAAEGHSRGKMTVEAHVLKFQQALVTFTPRLIATPGLILANVLVFAVMIATGVSFFSPDAQSLSDWGANFGPKTMSGQWWRLVTSMFLHFGILHLGFNMWVLWSLGRLVERLTGNTGFLLLYFVSGIAGSIARLASDPLIVSAGASGAVFGVAGALLGFIAFRRDTVPAEVLRHLWKSIAAFIAFNLFYGLTKSGIDNAAHIGGLVAGFGCGLILSQSLSFGMIVRRRVRNAALAVAAVVVLPLAVLTLPDAPPDIGRELTSFAEMEKKAIETVNSQGALYNRGLVSNVSFANTLEQEVLPEWNASRARIEKLTVLPYASQTVLTQLVHYMKLRQEAWQLLAEGVREQDSDKMAEAEQKGAEADEAAGKLSGL